MAPNTSFPTDFYENRLTQCVDRSISFLARHWLLWLNLALGIYAVLPWLSPVARAWGWTRLGSVLFQVYTPLCHQNSSISYHLLGYQVAYCQRDTMIYTTILGTGLFFGLFRRRIRPLPWSLFFLSLVPMALDGITHLLDFFFSGSLLRAENSWAVALTGGFFPATFYAGDGIGGLNWWLRTVSGVLFGLGFVLAIYPRIDREMRASRRHPKELAE
jgi:uncharacterized membrane protein